MSNPTQAMLVPQRGLVNDFRSLMSEFASGLLLDDSGPGYEEWDSDTLTFLVRKDLILILDGSTDWLDFLTDSRKRQKLLGKLYAIAYKIESFFCLAFSSKTGLDIAAAEGTSLHELLDIASSTGPSIANFQVLENYPETAPWDGFVWIWRTKDGWEPMGSKKDANPQPPPS